MKIHYVSTFSSALHYQHSSLINFVSLRNYLKKYAPEASTSFSFLKFPWEIDLNDSINLKEFLKHGVDYFYLGNYKLGKSIKILTDLEQVVKIYENFKFNRDLLDGIKGGFDSVIKQIQSLYNRKVSYDYVCFTIYEPFSFYCFLSAMYLKRNNPKIKIIFGGPGVNTSLEVSDLFVKMGINFVISGGDIESAVYQIINGKIKEGRSSIQPINMNTLSAPIYTKVETIASMGGIALTSSRGCFYNCGYCCSNFEKYRKVKMDTFIEWVEQNNNEYASNLLIQDPLVNSSTNRLNSLIKGLSAIDNKLKVFMQLRSDQINPDIIELMAKVNVKVVFLGSDIFSKSLRKKTGKVPLDFNIEKYISLVNLFNKNDIRVNTFFIYGLPLESDSEFNESLQLIDMLMKKCTSPKFELGLTIFTLLSNSPFYLYPEKFSIKIEYWKNISKLSPELNNEISKIGKFYTLDYPSAEEIIERFNKIIKITKLGDSAKLIYDRIN